MHLWAHDPWSAHDGSTSNEKCTPVTDARHYYPMIINALQLFEFHSSLIILFVTFICRGLICQLAAIEIFKGPNCRGPICQRPICRKNSIGPIWPRTIMYRSFFKHFSLDSKISTLHIITNIIYGLSKYRRE